MTRRNSREALLAAAVAEFSDKGFEAATVTDIAERAGVTTGALYAHFRGKLDLLLQALGITSAETFFRELAEVANEPWAKVSQVLSARMAADPEPTTLLLLDAIVAARRSPTVAAVLREGMAAYEKAMTRATSGGIALGLLDPALRADDLARVLTFLAWGRLVSDAIGAPAPSADAYERLAELLLQSSGATADEGDTPEIAQVRARARMVERARRDLAESAATAIQAGHSLRQVGAAAGVSHERVRQLVRETKPLPAEG